MANARRANIPLYRQTDQKYFPDYEMREYPKEIKDGDGNSIVTNPVYLMTTPRDPEAAPQRVLRNGKPVIIGGEPLVVNNSDEEAEFLKEHPESAKIVQVSVYDVARQAAQNEQMKTLLAENERLRAKLSEPVKRKPGRPAKVKETELPTDLA